MSRPPLRSLMLVPILVTVAIGFTAFSVYVDRSVHQDLIDSVDDEISRAEQPTLGRPGNADGGTDPRPPGPASVVEEVEAIDPPVELVLSSTGELLADRGRDNPFSESDLLEIAGFADGNRTFQDPAYRIRTTTRADGTLVVTALDLANVDATISSLRRNLLGGAMVILGLQAFVVWLITSSLTRPLTRMTASARRIAGGELDTDIGEPSGSRETVELAADLDRMLQQLRATLDSSERSAEDATQARNDMQRFLADASHELRTPLTALKGYSDLYAGDMLQQPGELDRAMSRIGGESERMSRLVNDMLQLARTGAVDATPVAAVGLGGVVTDVVDDLRAAHPGARIEIDMLTDDAPEVLGDRDELHQAILNIVSNAIRHGGFGTPVLVAVGRHDRDAQVRILDHGPGIASEHLERIFLPFSRIDASRARDGEGGAGLGLAVAKQIIDAHDGTIDVETTPGGGATFVVTLPLTPS